MSTLRHLLEHNRRRVFFGREQELAHAERFLAPDAAARVLFFAGAGGLGKSTLLTEIGARARSLGHMVIPIDASDHAAAQPQVAETLRAALRIAESSDTPTVLVVDTFEKWAEVEEWFYRDFMPTLPVSLRVVVAGREWPALRWRTDPAWSGLLQTIELGPFGEQEARRYLACRGLHETAWPEAWHVSRGVPLLLAVIVDVGGCLGVGTLATKQGRNRVQASLLELVREIDAPAESRALQAACMVRQLYPTLLAALLPADDAATLYRWLSRLSFVHATEGGLSVHELVREAVCSEFLKNDPHGHEQLCHRAEAFYAGRLMPGSTAPMDETVADLLYLSRHGKSTVMRAIEQLPGASLRADQVRPGDPEQASALVLRHQGVRQQALFEQWHRRQPEGFIAIRDACSRLAGFVQYVEFGGLEEGEVPDDPIIDECIRFVQQRGIGAGRRASIARFWLDRDRHLAVSAVQALAMMTAVWQSTGVEVDFCGMTMPDDVDNHALARFSGCEVVPGAAVELPDFRLVATLHDWRRITVPDWLLRTGQAIRGTRALAAPLPEPIAFRKALKHALRNFTRPDRLGDNPLLSCVAPKARNGDAADSLRGAIVAVSESFLTNPKTARYHAVLHHAYFRPAANQLVAAENLNMAPSSFYRHLSTATTLLANDLRRHLSEGQPSS